MIFKYIFPFIHCADLFALRFFVSFFPALDIHGWSLVERSRQNSYGNVRPAIINLDL